MRVTPDLVLGLAAQVPLSSLDRAQQHDTAFDNDSTVHASRAFTPKDLLQQPTVGTGIPNPSGTLLFVPYSQFSLDTDTASHTLHIHSVDALKPREYLHEIILPTAGDAFWYDDSTLITTIPDATDRTTSLYASYFSQDGRPENVASTSSGVGELIGVLPTDSAANFHYSSASHHLVFSARIFADGDLASAVQQERAWKGRKDSARAYDGHDYLRFWDQYSDPSHSSLFSTSLSAYGGRWRLGDTYVNLLNGTAHKTPPLDGLGAAFDVWGSQVVYVTKAPDLREPFHSKKNVYLIDIDGRSRPRELTSGARGEAFNPVFSPDGNLIAWLEQPEDAAVASKRYVVLYNIKAETRLKLLQEWDRSPEAMTFSADSTMLYLEAFDVARVKAFAYPLYDTPSTTAPVALTRNGHASGLQPLSNGRLIYTHRTLTSPGSIILLNNIHAALSDMSMITAREVMQPSASSFTAPHIYAAMEEFWFDGYARKIHGFVLKPRGWSPDTANKSWPVALLIHGGPEGMWGDSWSVPFNAHVYSQRGYFVVVINFTGSSSFGQAYSEAIYGDWGGAPLHDIVNGLKHVYGEYPEIDPKRSVAVGLSYGGYMVNLLQGRARELGIEFAALASMDGIFSTEYLAYTIDLLFFMRKEWLAWPWENQTESTYGNFSPHKFVHNWQVPQLIIHGDKDFRVPVTEGIATFNALQQRGVESRLLIFDNEPHVFTNPHNILIYYEEIFEWFERFAGSRMRVLS
ncbi:unnamed protein product [Peniophora sp. CBMAI 1063]|nr:unnamed protein product [Peniophora sp. CBMAI 1063]